VISFLLFAILLVEICKFALQLRDSTREEGETPVPSTTAHWIAPGPTPDTVEHHYTPSARPKRLPSIPLYD